MKKLLLLLVLLSSCVKERVDPSLEGTKWEIVYPGDINKTLEFKNDSVAIIVYAQGYLFNSEKYPYIFDDQKFWVQGIFQVPFKGEVNNNVIVFQEETFNRIEWN